jgi:GPH family glycoside/pentoside/hexuronide:cation symporter
MEKRLKFRNMFAYGVGDFGSNFCWTFVSAFILIYCTDTVHVGVAVISTLIMAARILDGFTDVVAGTLIDRTKSKMGKARPWLFWSIIPLIIAQILLFNVPAGMSDMGKYVYIFIWYMFLGAFCYTASNISYYTMLSLCTDNPNERITMSSIRFVCALIAALGINSVTLMLVNALGGGQKGWGLTAGAYAAIYGIFTMITVFGIREMKNPQAEGEKTGTSKKETVGFSKSVLLLIKNKYFIIMLLLYLVNNAYGGIGQSVAVYYVTYVLGDISLMGLISIASMIPTIIGVALSPKVIAKLGMQKTCIYGGIIGIAGSIVVMFSQDKIPVLMVGLLIRSLSTAPFIASMAPLVAETAEYSLMKFKTNITATIYSCTSVGVKIGTGVGVAAAGWFLAAAGYNGAAEIQGQGAITMIQGLYKVTPLIFSLAMLGLLILMNVEKTNAALKAEGEKTNA